MNKWVKRFGKVLFCNLLLIQMLYYVLNFRANQQYLQTLIEQVKITGVNNIYLVGMAMSVLDITGIILLGFLTWHFFMKRDTKERRAIQSYSNKLKKIIGKTS